MAWFFVNPDRKEFFNPALNGGYYRRRHMFQGGFQLYALELLMTSEVGAEPPGVIGKNLHSWFGNRLLIASEYNFIDPLDEPYLTEQEKSDPLRFLGSEYTDITRALAIHLTRTNPKFAEEYIPSLHIGFDSFTDAASLFYETRDKGLEKLLVENFGKNWEHKYKTSQRSNRKQKRRLK